ncbi:PH domain-containing protein [Nonomuraea sp. NPDC050383]|uniref:PH domain-containing protein n=1 Tax=Nonomuraea sp. NPDC050383 TaxID=3364362 RepID=UPI00378ABD42
MERHDEHPVPRPDTFPDPRPPLRRTARTGAQAGIGAEAGTGVAGVALRPPRHQADPRAVRWWTAQALMLAVPVAGGTVAAYWLFTGHPVVLGLLVAGFAGCCLVLAVAGPRASYRRERWEVTAEAVYTRKGWITHTWRVAPMSRIQTVDTARGPVQRLFGLADVTVTTASAAGPITIEGLDHELAAELAARLTAITQATPGDAT